MFAFTLKNVVLSERCEDFLVILIFYGKNLWALLLNALPGSGILIPLNSVCRIGNKVQLKVYKKTQSFKKISFT